MYCTAAIASSREPKYLFPRVPGGHNTYFSPCLLSNLLYQSSKLQYVKVRHLHFFTVPICPSQSVIDGRGLTSP